MMTRNRRLLILCTLLGWTLCAAGLAAGPKIETDPVLRLDGTGPMSFVTALAFSRDGKTLYQAGWDKVVRAWDRDPATGRLLPTARTAFRTPIGPGVAGAMNALAVSSDGAWVAVAGNGVIPGVSGFRENGFVMSRLSLTDDLRLAQGTVYVFDTRKPAPNCLSLRGHTGEVLALAFENRGAGQPPRLVSAASEHDAADPERKQTRLGLRYWELPTGKSLSSASGPAVGTFRPQLAIIPAGPGRETLVAAAWGRDAFVSWSPAQGRGGLAARGKAENAGGSLIHTSVLFDAGRNRLLDGRFPIGAAVPAPSPAIGAYDAALAAEDPAGGLTLAWAGQPAGEPARLVLPLSLALAASRQGGPKDLLAVVVRGVKRGQKAGEPFDHQLQLIDLAPGAGGRVRAVARLAQGTTQPFVTASADGRTLALGGNADDAVRVDSVDDLLAGKESPQLLRGDGAPARSATFARRGDQLGIVVGSIPKGVPGAPLPPPRADDTVFDATNRRTSAFTPEWTPERRPAGWQGTLDRRDGQTRVWVYRDGQAIGNVPVKPESPTNTIDRVTVTDLAVLPPRAEGRPPVVAVAVDEAGVGPMLRLYNGQTGAFVRQLTGHTGPIRSLEFSADGRLLLSASDDRTVSVWSLTDLDESLGRLGGLPGVNVATKGAQCVVERVEPPAGPALLLGDVVEGLVAGNRLVPFATAIDHYLALKGHRPGEVVTLRVARQAGRFDLPVMLGQSADERKPVLVLFLSTPAADGTRGWLAWTPSGPFDSDGEQVERLFGWHFNTDRPDEPARFARMAEGENRKLFRFEGLAAQTLALGRVPPKPEPPRPPLGFNLDVEPRPAQETAEGLLVRSAPGRLSLTLKDALERSGEVESATWRLDSGPESPLASDAPGSWEADISRLPLARGRHRLTTTVRSRNVPNPVVNQVSLVMIPPAPGLTLLRADGTPATALTDLTVSKPSYRLRARVIPTRGEPSRLAVEVRNGADTLFRRGEDAPALDAPFDLDETLTLKPGTNEIALVARNDRTDARTADLETTRLGPFVVTYTPEPASPPTVKMIEVATLPDDPRVKPGTFTLESPLADPLAASKVRLSGHVEAIEVLTEAQVWSAEAKDWRRLAGFVPGKGKSFDFREDLTLTPVQNPLRVRARAADSAWREVVKVVDYRPLAPSLSALAADPESRVVTHPQPARVTVSTRLGGPAALIPSDAKSYAIYVNGEALAGPPTLDSARGTLSAVVPLKERTSEITLVARNAWGNESRVSTVITYDRPPRVLETVTADPGQSPFTTVHATLDSLLPLTGAEVLVAGSSGSEPTRRREGVKLSREGDRWVVKAERVPLPQGTSRVRVRVWNADGAAETPAPGPEVTVRKVERVADVSFISPGADARVMDPAISARFRIHSASALARVALVRESSGTAAEATIHEADVTQATSAPDGGFDLEGEAKLTLERGPNVLRLEANNAGGQSIARLTITYVPPPVRVVIDSVEATEKRGKPLEKLVSDGRLVGFRDPLVNGQAVLAGRLVWGDPETRRSSEKTRVQFWVNGFLQEIATLAPKRDADLEHEFRVELFFSRPRNSVDVRLVGTAVGDDAAPHFQLDCTRTYNDQTMHLLVLGVGATDAAALRSRAISAVNGRPKANRADEFETPAFPRGRTYIPGPANLTNADVYGALRQIRRNLQAGGRGSNDIAVIFYEGGEISEGEETTLRLCEGEPRGQHDVMKVREFVTFFKGTRGAKLFLLDVTRGAKPQALANENGQWSRLGPEYGLLRFLWRKPSDLSGLDAPLQARLTTAFEGALRRSTTLKEVDRDVARQVENLQASYPNLLYSRQISDPMADLVLGRTDGGPANR